jgi:two-component system OmpR family response regulator
MSVYSPTGQAAVSFRPEAESPTRVLAVDDDPHTLQLIADYLGDNGLQVVTVASGRAIDAAMASAQIDLLVLDLRMPGEDGVQLTQRIRQRSAIPILILTGMNDEADRVMCLELGADDYLTKPFSPRELLARIRALVRRSRMVDNPARAAARVRSYRFAGWELNVPLRRLSNPDGEKLAISNGEFNLLLAFLTMPRRTLSRDELLDLTRVHNSEVFDRAIDTQVTRLRKKLEGSSTVELIRTDRGAGYRLDADVEALF